MAHAIMTGEQPDGSISKNMVKVSGPLVTLADTNTAQTLTNKTLTSPTITGATTTNCAVNVGTLAAAGSNFATANTIATNYPGYVFVTGADGTKGIALPVAVAGMQYTIKNQDSDNAILKVYPQVNSSINGTANSAISMAANTMATFFATNTTDWRTAKTPA